MNLKSIFITCFMMVSFSGLAQHQETITNSSSNNPNIALPESSNTLQLASGPVLYDNGSLVNSPGTGVGGLDESVLQNSSLGMNTLGLNHQVSSPYRIADDFTVPAGGWDISQVEFFAYQTGETASTITAVNVQIWDGPPGQVGSNVIFGDGVTNLMSQTAPADILRVTETTTGTSTDRQIAVSVVDINTILPAGTYWLDWQSDGSGFSAGPWAPPITINGNATTGNGLQSMDGGVTYGPAEDSGTLTQQGFPFIIYGAPPVALPVPSLSLVGMIGLLLFMLVLTRRFIRQ